MKKIAISLGLALVSVSLTAQDIYDGLRYSTQELTGTARFVGMGGAFGALGNDLSSLKVNPAGSAVFTTNAAAFTFDHRKNRVSTEFGDAGLEIGNTTSRRTRLGMPQAGGVFVFESNDPNATFRKFTFGVNYERTGNFNRNFRAFGTTNESIGNYFVGGANNFIPYDELRVRPGEIRDNVYSYIGEKYDFYRQEAFLALESGVISPITENENETQYQSNIIGSSYGNDMSQRESGVNSVINFNLGTQINDNLYIGANLNAHIINFDRFTSYYESVNNPEGEVIDLFYENDLRVRGGGFSMQLGAIYVIEGLRLGASVTTPTWYNIEKEITQGIDVFFQDETIERVFPNVINFFDYSFRSPGKATGSLAYVFGQSGLISLDYTYIDYTTQRFSNAPGFGGIIDDTFQATHNFNAGGEFVVNDWSFRTGYHFSQTPFKDDMLFGDTQGVSLGFGYKFGSNNIDFAWQRTFFDRADEFVQTGIQRPAFSNNRITQIMMTYSFLF